jgi:hypothetical protein
MSVLELIVQGAGKVQRFRVKSKGRIKSKNKGKIKINGKVNYPTQRKTR